MQITSKVVSEIRWPVGSEMKTVAIKPGVNSYEVDVTSPIVRLQLLALKDAGLISFELKLEQPGDDELAEAWAAGKAAKDVRGFAGQIANVRPVDVAVKSRRRIPGHSED